jgi:hypothetical protein
MYFNMLSNYSYLSDGKNNKYFEVLYKNCINNYKLILNIIYSVSYKKILSLVPLLA